MRNPFKEVINIITMKYRFDECVNRRGSGCYKWDEAQEEGVVPMWVADMDFRVAQPIVEALHHRGGTGSFRNH